MDLPTTMGLGTPLRVPDGWWMSPTRSVPADVPRGDKVRLASCLLKDMIRDWWEEVVRAIGDDIVLDAMT